MEAEQIETIDLTLESSDDEMTDVESQNEENQEADRALIRNLPHNNLVAESDTSSADNRINVSLAPIERVPAPARRPSSDSDVVNRINVELVPIERVPAQDRLQQILQRFGNQRTDNQTQELELPRQVVLDIPLEKPQKRILDWCCRICGARFACRPELKWHVQDIHSLGIANN